MNQLKRRNALNKLFIENINERIDDNLRVIYKNHRLSNGWRKVTVRFDMVDSKHGLTWRFLGYFCESKETQIFDIDNFREFVLNEMQNEMEMVGTRVVSAFFESYNRIYKAEKLAGQLQNELSDKLIVRQQTLKV